MLCNPHPISWLCVEESAGGFLNLDLGVDKFKVKLRKQDWNDCLPNVFSECLAQAHSLTAKEGSIGHRVTSLAIRCQKVLWRWIKSFRDETFWSNPLAGVVLKPMNVDLESLAIEKLILSDLAVSSYLMNCAHAETRVYAEDFINYIAEVAAGT